jgi:hypothetical protein
MKEDFKPGDIIYADSNFSMDYNCFGVVVNKEFWFEQVKKENVLEESLDEFEENCDIPFRVLGNKLFRQYWRANDPEEFEPDEHRLMHYSFVTPHYAVKFDLRPLIQVHKNILAEGFEGNVLEFLKFKNRYFEEVLSEARIVYDYLDGKRFDLNKENVFKKDKLLRLLEKAIPLHKSQ